ncbi:hypothetical protein LguiB_018667 [Lonicera macranthoides]
MSKEHNDLFYILGFEGKATYDEIILATEDFVTRYCIRNGAFRSVYKAILSSCNIVVVKKPHMISDMVDQKGFLNEILALPSFYSRAHPIGACLQAHMDMLHQYAYTMKVIEKHDDVYSFGVLALEVIKAQGGQPDRLEGDQEDVTFIDAHGVLRCSPHHDDWDVLDWNREDGMDHNSSVVYQDMTRAVPVPAVPWLFMEPVSHENAI